MELEKMEQLLDETFLIVRAFNRESDLMYYMGMLKAIGTLGIDWERTDVKHKLYGGK